MKLVIVLLLIPAIAWAREPSVRELRAAALRHHGLDPDRARAWPARARASALLPQLTLRAQRSMNRDEGVTVQDSVAGHLDVDVGHDLVVEARATWDLGRLVFSPDELRAAREGSRLAAEAVNLEEEVTRLYYQRRRAQIEMTLEPPEGPEALRRRLELEELGAQLDALTGDALSRALAEGHL